MVKRLLVLLPLFVGGTTAIAQTNFRPGYVLPLSGDTLRGEVDSRGAQRNARLARFRSAPGAAITEYKPQQLRGYGFTGDRVYQTEVVLLADSTQHQTLLDPTASAVKRTSFLEIIEQGAASLLYLRDDNSNDHYYLRMLGQPVQELIQTTRQVVENGVTYQRKSDEFRRTLAAATQQCLPLQASINGLRYSQTDLARLIRRYNECIGGPSVSVASATRKNHVQLGVMVGGERSQLTLRDYNITAKATSSVGPVVGLAASLRLAGVSPTISARVEALYEKQSYATEAKTSTGIVRTYRVKLESIRLPLTIRYTYPRGAIRPFLYAGFEFNFFLDNTNEIKGTYGWFPWIEKPRSLEQGIVGGLGLTTARANGHDIAVDLRYERSDGFSDVSELGSRLNRFYLLLSYNLTK
jgi:hypothetical protein